MDVLHHVNQGLRAHALYQRDVHYVVKDGQVIIVDEFTGRLMSGPPLVGWPAPGGRGQENG
jgi:preprotein translocase subunit SecA